MAVSRHWKDFQDRLKSMYTEKNQVELQRRAADSAAFGKAQADAQLQADEAANEAALLSKESKTDRRNEAYNSKAGQEGRNAFKEQANRSTNGHAETMQKFGQMFQQGMMNLLKGHSSFNSVLNAMWDAPGYIKSKSPNFSEGAPVKMPKPSDALTAENGVVKFNPDNKWSSDREKEFSKELFILHMANKGYSAKHVKDGVQFEPAVDDKGQKIRPELPSGIVETSELNQEIIHAHNTIKSALGKKVEFQDKPEEASRPSMS